MTYLIGTILLLATSCLACCLGTMILDASTTSHACWWNVEVVQITSLESPIAVLQDTEPDKDITTFIHNWNIRNILRAGESFSSYPYYLKLMISCHEELKSTAMGRAYALAGGCPQVSVNFKSLASEGLQSGIKVKTLLGALVDIGKFQSYDSIDNSTDLIDPAWLVPFSLDHISMVLEITILSLDVMISVPQSQKIHIHLDGYSDEAQQYPSGFGDVALLELIESDIMSRQVLPVIHIPRVTPTLALGPFGSTSVYIISNDEFITYEVFKSSILNGTDSDWNKVCNCAKPMEVASLPDRMLFLTDHGLIEMFGNFTCPFSACQLAPQNAERSFNICTDQVSLPVHAHYDKWHIMVKGACDQEGKLFTSQVNPRKGSTLQFTELLDRNNLRVCDNFSNSISCTLLASAVTAWNRLAFVNLVQVNYTTYSEYAFVQFADSQWEVKSTFLTDLSVGDNMEEPVILSDPKLLKGNLQTTKLVLNSLSIMHHISVHVYIWGNQLLHSSDRGKNIYLLPEFPGESNIILFVTSEDGFFCFLTDEGEMWGGVVGWQHLKKIYPSVAWDILSDDDQLPGNGTFKIVSMFFDSSDQLQMLTTDLSGGNLSLNRTMVPLGQLLRILSSFEHWASISSPWEDPSADEYLLSGSYACSFRAMFFSVPPKHLFERIQEYEYSPPDLNWNDHIHNNMSLMVYQAVVHQLEELYDQEHGSYADNYTNHIDRWKDIAGTSKAYDQFLFQTSHIVEDIQIDIEDYKRVYEDNSEVHATRLPDTIYLSMWQNYTFYAYFYLADNADIAYPNFGPIQLDVKVSDTDKVNVTHTSYIQPLNASIVYKVSIEELGQLNQQEYPGVSLYPASLSMSVWGASNNYLQCIDQNTKQQSNFQMTVILGCPATQKIVFDQQDTLLALANQSDKDMHFDCIKPDPDRICFYFDNGFYPVFRVFDVGVGQSEIFQGQYTLKVIGGSSESAEQIQPFTEDEIYNFNSPESKKVQSLILGPLLGNPEIEKGFPVYTYKTNGISWFCEANTPCANVKPKFPYSPEYYFLLEFSNKDIDSTTYCDFTMRFIVHVHGLPIHAIKMSLVLILVSTIIIVTYTGGFYVCYKDDAKLLTDIKQKIKSKIHPAPVDEPEIEEDKLNDPEYMEQLAAKDWRLALTLRLAGDDDIQEEEDDEEDDTEESLTTTSSETLSTAPNEQSSPIPSPDSKITTNLPIRSHGDSRKDTGSPINFFGGSSRDTRSPVMSHVGLGRDPSSPIVSHGYFDGHRGLTSIEQPSNTDINLTTGQNRDNTPANWGGARPKKPMSMHAQGPKPKQTESKGANRHPGTKSDKSEVSSARNQDQKPNDEGQNDKTESSNVDRTQQSSEVYSKSVPKQYFGNRKEKK